MQGPSRRQRPGVKRPVPPWARLSICAAGVLLGSVVAAGVGGCERANRGAHAAEPSFLTVMQASRGTLVPTGKPNQYTLTLDGVAPQTVAFSDRPRRIAATVGTNRLLRAWSREFKGAPPNAALVLVNGRPDADTVVLALRRPRADGRKVRFPAIRIPTPSEPIKVFQPTADPAIPRQFAASSLFVDGGGLMQLVAYGAQDAYVTGKR